MDGSPEDISRLMENLRNEGKMELRINEETGELEGSLTEEGMEEARRLWRGILELPEDTPIEELDERIAAAHEQMVREANGED